MKKTLIVAIVILTILAAIFLTIYFLSMHSNNSTVTMQSTSSAPSIQNASTSAFSSASLDYEISINLPNTVMIIDAQGKRAGEDPKTGTVFREMPEASGFGEDGKAGEMTFSSPLGSPFTLYVLAGQTGIYSLDVWITNLGKQIPPQRISGSINAGTMIAYVPNYNSINPASSTLMLSGVVSSTASITSAPPNNLPPPAVQ